MTVRAYGYENNNKSEKKKKERKNARVSSTPRERGKVTFFRICSVYTRNFLAIIQHGGGEKPESGFREYHTDIVTS